MKPTVGWTLALAALLVAMPLAASAQYSHHHVRGWHGDIRYFETHDRHHWHSGSWRHSRHGGRLGWWWVVGGAWYFYPQPVYPYPDPYQPPLVVLEQPAPVIVQVPAPVQTVPDPSPATNQPVAQFWYYCEAAKGYYPYVASCPSGWKTVPATPPGVPQ